MKKSTRTFFRSFFITAVIIGCAGMLLFGAAAVYRAVNSVAYARYDRAFSVTGEGVRFLDFYIPFN